MKLIEHLSFDQAKIVVENIGDDASGRKMFLTGICLQGGVRNLNERNYPIPEIRRAVEEINKQLNDGYSVGGELDHPEELTINLDRVSHKITQMWMDGPIGMGKMQILPTPCGNIARTLIENDFKLGVSSRGSGNVNERGEVSDYEIVTIDIVARPSAPDAYPRPVYEAFNHRRRGVIIEDLAKAVSHDPKAQKHLRKELLSWIDNLK